MGWILPHQSLMKKMPHRLSTGQSDGGISPFRCRLPRCCLGLCQADKKPTNTPTSSLTVHLISLRWNLALNLELGWLPSNASNPPASTLPSTGVTGLYVATYTLGREGATVHAESGPQA